MQIPMMNNRTDLDAWGPHQSELTRMIDTYGAAGIEQLVAQSSAALLMVVTHAYALPLPILQRVVLEMENRAQSGGDRYIQLKSDMWWNLLNFLQEHLRISRRAMEFDCVQSDYRRIFQMEPPVKEDE